MKTLTHVDNEGRAIMVDVSKKELQLRTAKARGHIKLSSATLGLIKENGLKKGDVLTVAKIAGINGAKETGKMIPLCHNIVLDDIGVVLTPGRTGITAESVVKCTGKTGAEMEALTAVALALLTVYDMCKAVDKDMIINEIKLIQKTKQ